MASNVVQCYDGSNPNNVNFGSFVPSVGQIWSVLDGADPETAKRNCNEITSLIDNPISTTVLTTQYVDCYECMSNNYFVYNVADCLGSSYPVTVESFGSLANVGEVYYFTISYGQSTVTSCFTIESIEPVQKARYEEGILYEKYGVATTTPSLETDCQTCLENNSLTYLVNRCTDGASDYVSLINSSFIGNLISYSDGINQYCGFVDSADPTGTPVLSFINDYGVVECEVCLATENEKILLQSCTDSEVQQVVWASSLYNGGEVSNLSTDDGCFEVIGLTEDPVTINNFLNFDPQPGCESCIECNGINYAYSTCSGLSTGSVKSHQYLPTDTVFYNPAIGECCYVTGTSGVYDDILYSVDTFGLQSETGCEDCQNNVDVVIWDSFLCGNENYVFNVTTDSTAQAGDIVKIMWGSNEWICVTLNSIIVPSTGGFEYYNTQDNESGTTLIYDSCDTCVSQGLIGVTLVSCDTGVESFVSISLENYLSIYNFGSLTNYSVSDYQKKCFTITNVCPIPLTSDGFTAVEFYFNCFECLDDNNPLNPRSANTETFICIPDCDFTGSTAVAPPHPIWTDGYGVPVTQLNMVLIGSGNGLNG